MTSVLVTGSKGQLGSEFTALAGEYPMYDFRFIDVGDVDMMRPDLLEKFFKDYHPDIIINCAAYTAVDLAESETEKASVLNVDVPEFLASMSKRDHSLLIHFSTDYVFDGKDYRPYKETDPPDPQSIYGKTKLDGENAILMLAERAVIIRTSWLYSSFGKNFVKTMIEKGKINPQFKVVYDQIGSPTYAFDLAETVLKLIPSFLENNQNEIYHYANEGVTSWYDFAITIFEMADMNCKVEAIETKDYPTPAQRPPYSVLNKSKIKSLGISIPYWKKSLKVCLLKILQNKS